LPASPGVAPEEGSAIATQHSDPPTLSFEPHEGDEAPFFVCYARDDGRRIYPVLEALHRAGLPIWFDRGIAPGAVWTDVLAESIERARTVIFFLTSASARSRFCRAELEFAFQHGVPVLVVELEAAKMPSGLELQIGSLQRIEVRDADAARVAEAIAAAAEGLAVRANAVPASRARRLAFAALVCVLSLVLLYALSSEPRPGGLDVASPAGSGREAGVPPPPPRESPGRASERLRDPAAHLAYLQGLGELRRARSGPEIEQTIATLESAIAVDPGHAAAFAALCRAHLLAYARSSASSELAAAESACAAADERAPEDYGVLLARAELMRVAGGRDAALRILERAATLYPDDARIERERAMALELPVEGQTALERSRALADAEAAFEHAIALEPGYWGHRADYGRFLFRVGRDAEALEVFRSIAESQPDSAEAQADYGAVLMNAGENLQARRVLERAVKLAPPNAQALTNLGLLYSFEEDYARAEAMQERAVRIEGEDHRYWGRLAEARFMQDDGESARAAWEFAAELVERSLDERPDDATALGMAAYYLAALHAEERADAAIARALERRGDDRETLYYLAVASCMLERSDVCARFARRSVEAGMPMQYIEDEPALAGVLEKVRAPGPEN
jgi:tetratricopeptide (TPR) repeat protein